MRLAVQNITEGMHPSEKLVTIKTEEGLDQLFVDGSIVENGTIPVSHALGQHNGHRLVELPRETMRGIWRVWVEKADLEGWYSVIFTDREIQIALEIGSITIDPKPDQSAFSSTSVDLTLDSTLLEFNKPQPGLSTIIEPASSDFRFSDVITSITQRVNFEHAGYIIHPQKFILAWTRENVNLLNTSRVAGRVEGKSSLARLGIGVHITAPTIHAGFQGKIQLEIYNHGSLPVKLVSGQRICQLIFEQTLGVPNSGYKGQFLGQGA
jgi:dCTP deaminase